MVTAGGRTLACGLFSLFWSLHVPLYIYACSKIAHCHPSIDSTEASKVIQRLRKIYILVFRNDVTILNESGRAIKTRNLEIIGLAAAACWYPPSSAQLCQLPTKICSCEQ